MIFPGILNPNTTCYLFVSLSPFSIKRYTSFLTNWSFTNSYTFMSACVVIRMDRILCVCNAYISEWMELFIVSINVVRISSSCVAIQFPMFHLSI